MASPDIVDYLKTYSGLMATEVNSRIGYKSKLYAIHRDRRQDFPTGKGFSLKHVQYDQVGITADSSADFVAADNAAYPEALKANTTSNYGGSSSGDSDYQGKNNVDPPIDKLDFKQSEIGYGIIQKAFQTKPISVESLRAAADAKSQVNELTKLLTDYTMETVSRIVQDETARVSGNRFIATGSASTPTFVENTDAQECFTSSDASRWNRYGWHTTAYNVVASTPTVPTISSPNEETISTLTWGHLDEIYTRALRDGLGDYETIMAQGMPVLYCVTDNVSAMNLLRDSDSGWRTDLRESSEADKLLTPFGVTHTIRGWVILPEAWTRRFTISGDTDDSSGGQNYGTWAEQQYYSASTTNRTKNSAWASATCVESYVLTPAAFNSYVPKPSYSGEGAARFTPQNFAGDYEFFVDKDVNDNPWGAHGVFQGKVGCGTLPLEKTLLYTVRHTKGTIGA